MTETLDELIREGRVVPFIGAGFSYVAGFPGWFGLLREVFEDIHRGDDFDVVAASCGHDPLRVAEYLLVRSGGKIGPIRHRLSSILRTPKPFVSSAHIDLANLRLPVVYTTNFDQLIEETYTLLDLPVDVCCTARDLVLARGGRGQVVKFHGDLQYDDTLVLTESSFQQRLDFEAPLDIKFRGDIIGRSLLFIGYGFGDINVRAIWFKLSNLMSGVPIDELPPSYIVRISPDPVLETLDRAAGLTTIVLDPEGAARTSDDRQRLLEGFMLTLSLAADPVRIEAKPAPTAAYCSPALLKTAATLVLAGPPLLDETGERVLSAVASRKMHPSVQPEAAHLLEAFGKRRQRGQLADYRKAITLNLVMNYGL